MFRKGGRMSSSHEAFCLKHLCQQCVKLWIKADAYVAQRCIVIDAVNANQGRSIDLDWSWSANDACMPEKITLLLSIWLTKMSQCGWSIGVKIVHQSIPREQDVLLVCLKSRCCCVQLQDPIGGFSNSFLSYQHRVLVDPMGNSCLGKTVFWSAFNPEP